MSAPKLKIVGLAKSFAADGGSRSALRSINLTVTPNEVIAIIGPSGCGKTTLLNILAGALAPDTGEFYLDGQRVAHCQQAVAYLPQKDLLLPWRTALENAILSYEIVSPTLTPGPHPLPLSRPNPPPPFPKEEGGRGDRPVAPRGGGGEGGGATGRSPLREGMGERSGVPQEE